MTNYRNGARIEYKAKAELEKDGYYVIRSAGSHGVFDLVAIGFGKLRLIQLKRTRSKKPNIDKLFKKDMQLIYDFCARHTCPENTDFELWVWKKNGKEWVKRAV